MGWFGRDKKPSTGSEGALEEKIRKLFSDCEAAEKIVNEYGGVLEITSQMVYGTPQSLLPRPKAEIKQAIMKYLFGLNVQKTLDKKTFDLLKVGYISLASFLDDADAKAAVAAQGALNSRDPERIASPTFSAVLERFEKSNEESKALSAEFDAAVAKLGVQF
jgi:hypothetical protein